MIAKCPGCGAALQHEDPDKPGYVPASVADAGGGILCRRCFRMRHYGKADGSGLAPAKARDQIAEALRHAEAVVVVMDLTDFEGSLPPDRFIPRDKPVILVVNKADLLPAKSNSHEIKDWVRARWRAFGRGPDPRAVVVVSAKNGSGLPLLTQEMIKYSGRHQILAIIGATSVGKTTLMQRFLSRTSATEMPTVARFPGTTQAATRWYLEQIDLTIYDTPGFVPGDRLIDHLCPECAAHLVADRRLGGKLYDLKAGQALILGGWAAFIPMVGEPRTFQAYASEQIAQHRTNRDKAEALLAAPPAWLWPWPCAGCRRERHWRSEEVPLEAGEDLAVAGLGWISLRGGPSSIRVVLPQGVGLVRRPALFGPRKRIPAAPV